MPSTLDLEIGVAAYKVVRDLVALKKGESILITIDSMGYWRIAEETAKAAEALGAKVMVAWHSTPPGYGKVGDPFLPDSLKAAIPETDVWVEYNNQWLLYSTPWEKALTNPKRVRYLFLGGLDEQQFVRCVGKIDLALQKEFQDTLVGLTRKARKMRITNPAGTDVSFENDPGRPVTNEGWALEPSAHFLLGQIGWAPVEDSINGVIAYNGSFSGGGEADLGILTEPISFHVKKGVCEDITGGDKARFLKGWFARLNDPLMFHAAHVCYGFNPGARLSGLCTEDERVWGSTEWGFGYQGPFFKGRGNNAKSHVDGICLDSSVWMDGQQIMDKGKLLHPKLAELAVRMGKQ
jgi:leucyl aminopeptidase (aminopeptidase T)